jgi:hypothetical protein
MHVGHAKNMNEALKHNSFIFQYNAEVEIIIFIIMAEDN